MSAKKILIITYYWPPSGGVGVQRWLHFASNLRKMGWEPVVYTPDNPQFEIKDENLHHLAEGIKVLKKPIWEPFSLFHALTGSKNKRSIQQGLTLEKSKKTLKDKLFVWLRGNLFVPDARVFWVKPSVKYLYTFINENQIEVVITTGPPHSMHLIGLRLKKKHSKLKWIADFRDPWSDWDILERLKTGPLAMMKHRSLERKVLKNATRVISVSKRLAQSLEEKVGNTIKVELIKNGVTIPEANKMPFTDSERFVIGYFGMLNELRDPDTLWTTLEYLCEANSDFHSKLEIRLGGIVSESIVNRLKESKTLHDKVTLLGYVSHQSVFEEYRKCDVLLLLLNKSDNAKWILPVKFFEYLSAQKPILTFGPLDSDLGDILKEHTIGEMMSGENEGEISTYILSIFEGRNEVEASDYQKLLAIHSRENQAKELELLIKNL